MDYSKITLGELLSDSDTSIKRSAMSILKQLQRKEEGSEICNFGDCKNKAVFYGVCKIHKELER